MTFDYGIVWALMGVMVAVAMGAMGSSFGVGMVSSAFAGLLAKKPDRFGQSLALVALPSTHALYGLLFGFVILIQTGLLTGTPKNVSIQQGLGLFAAAVTLGICTLFAGYWQGKVGAASAKIIAEKPENSSQALILLALIETMAVFGLVIALMVAFIGIKIV